MEIPIELDLQEYMSPECHEMFYAQGSQNDDLSSSHYDFCASVNHVGSVGFGHYWSIVAGPDGNYYKLDDELVTQVSNLILSKHDIIEPCNISQELLFKDLARTKNFCCSSRM